MKAGTRASSHAFCSGVGHAALVMRFKLSHVVRKNTAEGFCFTSICLGQGHFPCLYI